ncbi:MAG: hypothetical protein ACFFG0_20440, partial [Candidatus Thorarchaeota archaeon]
MPKERDFHRLQHIFNTIISELEDYLQLKPLYNEIIIKLGKEQHSAIGENISVFDVGVRRTINGDNLLIELDESQKEFFQFILLREAYYSFVDNDVSEVVKVCINQIVENDLSKLATIKEWKAFIRNIIVDKDFIHLQFDKLQKFFKMEAKEPFDTPTQFFFKELRWNLLLSQDNTINYFY